MTVQRVSATGRWVPPGVGAAVLLALPSAASATAGGCASGLSARVRSWVAGLLAGLATRFELAA